MQRAAERQSVDECSETGGLGREIGRRQGSSLLRGRQDRPDQLCGLHRCASRCLGKALVRSRCGLELDPYDGFVSSNGIEGKELAQDVCRRGQPLVPAEAPDVELGQDVRCSSYDAVIDALDNGVERETKQLLAAAEKVPDRPYRQSRAIGDAGQTDPRESLFAKHIEQRIGNGAAALARIDDLGHEYFYSMLVLIFLAWIC